MLSGENIISYVFSQTVNLSSLLCMFALIKKIETIPEQIGAI